MMSSTVKRAAEGPPDAGSQQNKVARLDVDRVAPMPAGSNLIEIDGKSCTHEVCWPPGEAGSMAPPGRREGPPAREYPFQLDPFQQTAINCLENGASVLVAAHTSAGKTVVAEYAFGMALRDGARVVYTSPLKALSNQKYRELAAEFTDVGLLTGDVTINPHASCLVMTTEILRSMLYRGSEVVREVSLIIYDEVHYLRDAERGVVWEESIILAPRGARFVFLSATIPNAREFAGWVSATHGSPVHVVYTEYRPTPLQHYIFPSGADGLFLVVDERGTFREDNFQKAVAALADAAADGGRGGKGRPKAGGAKDGKKGGHQQSSDIFLLVKMVMERGFDPLIVFSFSKRECEALASSLAALDLTTPEEKALVEGTFAAAIAVLGPEDQKLPQIANLLPLLRRGIGVHHSGLLPILKELVELMFQEGWLKVLFATETFSTGLNMPAKTVAFTHARKYDGGRFRWVSSGEYIQMSGRAGRRGLDDRGIVILLLDTKMEPAIAKDMVKGAPDPLTSAFALRYSQLLALARVDGASPEQLLGSSFRQWQLQRSLPALEARAAQLAEERDALVVPQEEQVSSALSLLEQRAALRAQLAGELSDPLLALPFLQPGRLVRVAPAPPDPAAPLPQVAAVPSSSGRGALAEVVEQLDRTAWGVLINFELAGKRSKQQQQQGISAGTEHDTGEGPSSSGRTGQYIIDVLLNCDPATVHRGAGGPSQAPRQLPRLLPPSDKSGVALVITLPLDHLDRVSAVRLKALQDLRTQEARAAGLRLLAEVLRRSAASGSSSSGLAGGEPPLLDPEQDMKVKDKAVRKLVSRLESVEVKLEEHPLLATPTTPAAAAAAGPGPGSLATAAAGGGEGQAHPALVGLAALQQKHALTAAVRAARKDIKAAQGLVLGEELRCRQRLLRRLGYLEGEEGLISVKGRLAADLTTGDELVLAELVFGGTFGSLDVEQLAAVCSCFVWGERTDKGAKLRESLTGPLSALRDAARRVAKAAQDAQLPVNVEEYVGGFRHELMEPVAAWVRGARFVDVLGMTDLYEGSLVRAVRRLEELMSQLAGALRGIGEVELAGRFDEACGRIKRDIIFAASLYL